MPPISINQSKALFFHDNYVETVLGIAARHDVPAHLLHVEVTESMAWLDEEAFIRTLDALRRAGIGLSLDDFGKGYSSMAMLHSFGFDTIKLDRAFLNHCGESIQLFPGVREWFARINAFGESLGVQVEHYVISSGLREIIEGSGIAQEFREIYACEFYYNENGDACWPKLDVNFTNKTQFVYRINKGILDVSRDKELNDSMPDDSKRVPFTNMIYMGDGLSDVPCMKMMRAYGGQAIAVYQASNRQGVEKLLADGRVDFIFPADYREDMELDRTVRDILRKMTITDRLLEVNNRQLRSIGGDVLPNQVGLF